MGENKFLIISNKTTAI